MKFFLGLFSQSEKDNLKSSWLSIAARHARLCREERMSLWLKKRSNLTNTADWKTPTPLAPCLSLTTNDNEKKSFAVVYTQY